MKQIPDHLFKKLEHITSEVKEKLKKKGIVVPSENTDGSISLGNYKILKKSSGFYSILDYGDRPVVEGMNLPQTAVIVANGLALGRFLDHRIVEKDRLYGYAVFEETAAKKGLQKVTADIDRYDLLTTKCLIAQAKKSKYKFEIDKDFEKLRKFL